MRSNKYCNIKDNPTKRTTARRQRTKSRALKRGKPEVSTGVHKICFIAESTKTRQTANARPCAFKMLKNNFTLQSSSAFLCTEYHTSTSSLCVYLCTSLTIFYPIECVAPISMISISSLRPNVRRLTSYLLLLEWSLTRRDCSWDMQSTAEPNWRPRLQWDLVEIRRAWHMQDTGTRLSRNQGKRCTGI